MGPGDDDLTATATAARTGATAHSPTLAATTSNTRFARSSGCEYTASSLAVGRSDVTHDRNDAVNLCRSHPRKDRQRDKRRPNTSGDRKILRLILERLAIIRLHVQRHPMQRGGNCRLVHLCDEGGAINIEEFELQADCVQVPRVMTIGDFHRECELGDIRQAL